MNKHFLNLFLVLAVAIVPVETARAAQLPAPDVFISNTRLQQADTVVIAVKNEVWQPTGRIGNVPLHFFQTTTGAWEAISGIKVSKTPGTYKLVVFAPGYKTFSKNIVVVKRKFPITVLAITPQQQQQGYTAKKIINTVESQENAILQKSLAPISDKPYSTKPFIKPLSEMQVMGNYGDIRKSGALKIQHLGADLKAPIGTNVLAVNDGKVVFEGSLPDYGNTLVIDHGLGVYSLYLHLSEFKASEGDAVTQGQVIALSGDTGYVTGPHLHFSIKIRGASVDPLKFIEATRVQD